MATHRRSVSVVVVTRDRPRLLADALRSVAAQTAPPLEVRIADDGSLPVHEAIESSGLLEVTLLEAGAGQPGAARNVAARDARGEVLAFLDDDDRWLPDHLAGLVDAMIDPDVQFAFRDCAVVREIVGDHGARVEIERRVIACDWDPEWMRHDDYLPPSVWAVRRGLFERLHGFDTTLRYSEDWDFLLRAAAVTRPRRVPGLTVEVRMRDRATRDGEANASESRDDERRACLDRLSQRHGLPPLEIKTFWDVARDVAAP